MSNEKNLVPFTERTESEQRAIQQKGGIASGAARRRKRSLKEAADVYLSLPVADRRRWNKLARRCIDPEDIDNQMAMIVGLTEAATAGDARAATVIVKLLGEETPREDTGADQLARAAELLEGIDGVTSKAAVTAGTSKSARRAAAKAGWITPSLFPNVCWHFVGKELR